MNNKQWLEFWKQVQSDFLKQPDKSYFCEASPLFENEWDNENVSEIFDFAENFLDEVKNDTWEVDGIIMLFWFKNPEPENTFTIKSELREIRIEFLNWIIKKLEK